jgi:hypothetical protein
LEVSKQDNEERRSFVMTKTPGGPSQKDDSATDISDGERPKMTENEVNLQAEIDPKYRLPSTSSDNVDATGPRLSRKKSFPRKPKIMRGASDDDSASAQHNKKVKKEQAGPSDDDSDSEPRRRGSSSKRGGAKQPIKRGGRRF